MENSHDNKKKYTVALRSFLAFLALSAVLAGVLWPSYLTKRNSAYEILGSRVFAGLAMDIRHHLNKIEYGLRNGRDLLTFYGIEDIMSDIVRLSSYIEGVYVVGHDDLLLHRLQRQSSDDGPLMRPADMEFQYRNQLIIQASGGGISETCTDMFFPVFTEYEEIVHYALVRVNNGILEYSVGNTVNRETIKSTVIFLEFLGLGLIIVILLSRKNRESTRYAAVKQSAAAIFLIAFAALAVDFALMHTEYTDKYESMTALAVNRAVELMQSDVDTVLGMGVPPHAIYDINGWLQRSVQDIQMIHNVSIDNNMRISAMISDEYLSGVSYDIAASHAYVFIGLIASGAVFFAACLLYGGRTRGKIKKGAKPLPALLAVLLAILPAAGCPAQPQQEHAESVKIEIDPSLLNTDRQPGFTPPQTKPDGSRFKIAYAGDDGDPVSGMLLYHLIMALRDDGWIYLYDSIPFGPAEAGADMLIDWMAEQEYEAYIEFDRNMNYRIGRDSDDDIRRGLAGSASNGEIDMVLAMGTQAALFLKSLDLGIPVMIFNASDAVTDEEFIGPDPYIRHDFSSPDYGLQLYSYNNYVPFKNVGIVHNYGNAAVIEKYIPYADVCGANVVLSRIERISGFSDMRVDRYYEELEKRFESLIRDKGIDAFILMDGIIEDMDKAEGLLEVFTENRIPVFVQSGEHFVEHGALMYVSAIDYAGLGRFGARAITGVLSGGPAYGLEGVYANSPYICLNIDTAVRIGYRLDLEMLLTCTRIYGT